jgi:hypothetical protein
MISKDIIEYIKVQTEKGWSQDDIRSALISAGWQINDIDDAFRFAESNVSFEEFSGNRVERSRIASLPGAGYLLAESWGIYSSRIKTFAGIVVIQLIALVVLYIGLFVLIYLFGSVVFGSTASALVVGPRLGLPYHEPTPISIFSNILSFLSGFVILFVVYIAPLAIIQAWGQASMIYILKDNQENISAVEAYRRSWRKIGSLFWVNILTCLIVAGGFALFGIPGVIFAVWFSLAGYIVVVENISGMNALLKSREYIRGMGWQVFGLLLVTFLIWAGIWIASQFVTMFLSMIFVGSISVIISFVLWIFIAMLAPFLMTYSFLIYKYLREIKGDIVFNGSAEKKLGFIVIGILGILAGIGMFVLPLLLLTRSLI